MEKGVVTENVSHSIILQMGCLPDLVAVENILLVHPGSSHKAHQDFISISTKAPVSEGEAEAEPGKNCEAKDTSPVQ